MISLKNLPFAVKRLPFVAVLFVYIFITSGCIITCICLLLQLVWIMNKTIYRRIIGKLSYMLIGQMIWACVDWADTQITLFGDEETYRKFGKEYSLVTLSHRGDFDWLVGLVVLACFDCVEAMRTLPKKSVFYVPGFGQLLWALECRFLNRKWQKDQLNIQKTVKAYGEYPIPIQVAIFCEGTRFTEDKYEEGIEYARRMGVQPLKHHLMPRTKGYAILAESLKKDGSGSFENSYDVGFAYPSGQTYYNGQQLTLRDVLAGNTIKVYFYMRKIPMSELPSTIEELQSFCHQMYVHKDEAYQYFIDHGTYPAPSKKLAFKPYQIWKLRLNIAVWGFITAVIPGYWLLKQALLSSSWVWLCLLIGLGAVVMTYGLLAYARTSQKKKRT